MHTIRWQVRENSNFCKLGKGWQSLARAYHRTLRVKLACKIADLAGSEEIQSADLAEASFAAVLSRYATRCYGTMEALHIG